MLAYLQLLQARYLRLCETDHTRRLLAGPAGGARWGRTLRQQQLVLSARALGPDSDRRGLRAARAVRGDRVGAWIDGHLQRRGVLRVDRSQGLTQTRTVDRQAPRGARLVAGDDRDRPGAETAWRSGHACIADLHGDVDRDGWAEGVRALAASTAAERTQRCAGDDQRQSEPSPSCSTHNLSKLRSGSPSQEQRGPYPIHPRLRRPMALAEPDGSAFPQHLVQRGLDSGTDVIRGLLDEGDVIGRLGTPSLEVNGLEEADPKLRRQVHRTRQQTEMGEGVVDREVDQPGEA